jgi:hypothetical protein
MKQPFYDMRKILLSVLELHDHKILMQHYTFDPWFRLIPNLLLESSEVGRVELGLIALGSDINHNSIPKGLNMVQGVEFVELVENTLELLSNELFLIKREVVELEVR